MPPQGTLVIDQMGGKVRLSDGRVARDGTRSGFTGKAPAGQRCMFFVAQSRGRREFYRANAYELRDGQVFELEEEGSEGKTLFARTRNKADSLSDEQRFLRLVRNGRQ